MLTLTLATYNGRYLVKSSTEFVMFVGIVVHLFIY